MLNRMCFPEPGSSNVRVQQKEGLQMLIRLCAAHLGLLRDEKGATAIEYGMIAALIAVIIIGAITTIGTDLLAAFTSVANGL